MIELIAFVIFISLFVLLIIDNLVIRRKHAKSVAESMQFKIDNLVLQDSIKKLVDERDLSSIEQTDGFLKFVSQSRDWAFQYIEEVQDALDRFDKAISSQLTYAETYGSAAESHHTPIIKAISAAYSDLKSVLPKNEPDL